MTISTRTLENLPGPEALRRICKSIAVLDLILEPDWEYRYYSYNAHWDKGEEMASMRDGEGNFVFILFRQSGVILKGYCKDSAMGEFSQKTNTPWPGVLDHVPAEFLDFLKEPAFFVGEATFCVWHLNPDSAWQRGNIRFPIDTDPDGSERLLAIYDGNCETYRNWAKQYHEILVPSDSVNRIYLHEPLSEILVQSINKKALISRLRGDIDEIQYPVIV